MILKRYDIYEVEDEYDFTLFESIEAILLENIEIKEEFKGLGYGTKFVEELKLQEKPIILYSLFEAEGFWEKQGFKNCFSYIYVWGIEDICIGELYA
ncbi:hypothetical protein ACFFIX_19515 [Metabacillus herbersteinensis]|uniref:N-acetyltransferase domain-containing protein n=1 Tax=Metabacillus herbersteinensis TaxID=283816 RepID=A0ABV6GJE7_9BACI